MSNISSPSLSQAEYEAQFLDYLENVLSADERSQFEQALERNPALRSSFADYQRVLELERELAAEELAQPRAGALESIVQKVALEQAPITAGKFAKFWSSFWAQLYIGRYAFTGACVLVLVLRLIPSQSPEMSKFLNEESVKTAQRAAEPASLSAASGAPESAKGPVVARELQAAELPVGSQQHEVPAGGVANDLAAKIKAGADHLKPREGIDPIGKLIMAREADSEGISMNDLLGARNNDEPTEGQAVSKLKANGKDYIVSGGQLVPLENFVNQRVRRLAGSGADKKQSVVQNMPSSVAAYTDADRRCLHCDIYQPAPSTNESYTSYEENPRVRTQDEALSTFSIDVDTASYANARRFLQQGNFPPADAVRIEEFLNYFDYSYPQQSERPFTLSYEIAPAPGAQGRHLLKLGIKARSADAESSKGWNLVFLVDVSGSMDQENKLPLVKKALRILAQRMRPEDSIAIVTYAGGAGLQLAPSSGSQREQVLAAIDRLSAGGSTHGSAGIQLAYQIAEQQKRSGAVNRVILATDGDFNVGLTSQNELISLIEEKRRSGISLTTIGVGTDNLKDGTIEQLANKGNGNYFYLDSLSEARKVMQTDIVGNMQTVAKDVKLQIEFNPEQVLEYRLIGYDNRRLSKQDFNSDAIDAGEIGAGHTVTALYEVVLKGSHAARQLQPIEYRYQQAATASPSVAASDSAFGAELAFLKVRYKDPEASDSQLLQFPIERKHVLENWEQASNDFRFAAAVSYFAASLRQSKYRENLSYAEIASLAEKALGEDRNGYRREFVELVRNAAAAQRR